MKIDKSDFGHLPFSRLFCDYLQNKKEIRSFYSYSHTYSELIKAIEAYRYPGDRKIMARIIEEQNRQLPLHPCALNHLDALSHENSVAITTGQQLSLFGGPLLTVFKILSVVHLAKKLSRDTKKRVIPFFWLADEDHDYEEIAAVKFPVNEALRSFSLKRSDSRRFSIGRLEIEPKSDLFFKDIFSNLSETDFHPSLVDLLESTYSPGVTFSRSFSTLMSRLFSHHGLLFAGSNDESAKSLLKEKFQVAIEKASEIDARLHRQSKRLSEHYHQQARVGESLLFRHDEESGRIPLKHENGRWFQSSGVYFSTKELLEKLDQEPGSFSPNVFLRPIIQDFLLPNVAYAGGPAEIAYHGQMNNLYPLFDQKMPFIASRFSGTIIEPGVNRLIKKLPFKIPEYLERLENLEKRYLQKEEDRFMEHLFSDWIDHVGQQSNEMLKKAGITDFGLLSYHEANKKRYQEGIQNLQKKMISERRKSEHIQINRLRKIKNALFPEERLQEREISFIYFMNKYGIEVWDRLIEKVEEEDYELFSVHHRVYL